MPLFTDDMIIYIENLKELTEKLLELVSKYSKAKRVCSQTKVNCSLIYQQRTNGI